MATAELARPPLANHVREQTGGRLLVLSTVALAVVAVGLRCWHLGNIPGLNGDEAWSGIQALKLLGGEPIEWRTPTGNPVNIFFLLPQVILHAIFPRSIELLRVVPLVSGLAALAVNYWLCRMVFDRATALISTMALAILPINIAYSRFAWDASQTVLATLPVLYLPLLALADRPRRSRWLLLAMVAYAGAILVHPTNILAGALLVMPALFTALESPRWSAHPIAGGLRSPRFLLLAGVLTTVAVVAARSVLGRNDQAAHEGLLEFMTRCGQLFSGTTVYRYIPGMEQTPSAGVVQVSSIWIDLAAGLAAVLAGYAFLRMLRTRSDDQDIALAASCGVLLLAFFVLAGPQALAPGIERYAIVLVAPCVVLISRGLRWWLAQPKRRSLVLAIYSLYGWITLTTFYVNYFVAFEQGGGAAHLAFHTAAVEPKLQAMDYILSRRRQNEHTIIYTDPWWLRKPLEYFAHGRPGIETRTWSNEEPVVKSGSDGHTVSTWFVEFAGSERYRELQPELARMGVDPTPRKVISSYAEKDLVLILRQSEKFLKK